MQNSIALSHNGSGAQVAPAPAAVRRREFIPFDVLMSIRALAGPRACRRRKLIFTQKKRKRAQVSPLGAPDNLSPEQFKAVALEASQLLEAAAERVLQADTRGRN